MRLLPAAALALLAPLPAMSACDAPPPPPAEVRVTVAGPLEPSILPAGPEVIRQRAAATGRALPEGQLARGLTIDRSETRAETRLTAITQGAERCVALTAIEATVAGREVTVLVDRQYRPGTCPYRAILDHEREHVRINAEAQRDTGRELEASLRDLAGAWGGRWLPESGMQALQVEIDEAVRTVGQAVQARAGARHARIDTAESYAEVQARCDAW
jgi:hypothetical protein